MGPADAALRKAAPCSMVSRVALARAGQRLARARQARRDRRRRGAPPASANSTASFQPEPISTSVGQPACEAGGIGNQPVMHRALQPVAVGKTADRKGRRQPGHQPQQRDVGWSVMAWCVRRDCANAMVAVRGSALHHVCAHVAVGRGMAVIVADGHAAGIGAAHRLERLRRRRSPWRPALPASP